MAEHKSLYVYSRTEAERIEELDMWTDSYRENCICARDIERAIQEGYKNNRLDKDCAKKIIDEHSFERVNWVLANTIQDAEHDGRYSQENKAWAKTFFIPKRIEERKWNSAFHVRSHPGLVDIFTNQARKLWQDLGLYEKNSCYGEKMDFTGKVVLLNPKHLKDKYKSPEHQLFYAETGFGCRPETLGTKVFGRFLKDGEKDVYHRSDFFGVMKLDLIPDWAKEKVNEWQAKEKEQGEEIKIGEQNES